MLATFLYEGRCYTSCPERSYAAVSNSGDSTSGNSSPLPADASFEEELIELTDDANRQQQYRPLMRAIKMPDEPPPPLNDRKRLCLACHFSCLKCRGPNDYDCSECAPDSVYTERQQNATYCLPLSSINKLKRMYDDDRLYMVLLILVPALFILCFVLFISWLLRTKCCVEKGNAASGYVQYNKIRDMDDEAGSADDGGGGGSGGGGGVGDVGGVGVRMPLDLNDCSSSDDDDEVYNKIIKR